MKVRLLIQVSGMRDGQVWPPPNSVVDLPDDEATVLVQAGSAELVEKKLSEKPSKHD